MTGPILLDKMVREGLQAQPQTVPAVGIFFGVSTITGQPIAMTGSDYLEMIRAVVRDELSKWKLYLREDGDEGEMTVAVPGELSEADCPA